MQCFPGQIELLPGYLQGGRNLSVSLESSLDSSVYWRLPFSADSLSSSSLVLTNTITQSGELGSSSVLRSASQLQVLATTHPGPFSSLLSLEAPPPFHPHWQFLQAHSMTWGTKLHPNPQSYFSKLSPLLPIKCNLIVAINFESLQWP